MEMLFRHSKSKISFAQILTFSSTHFNYLQSEKKHYYEMKFRHHLTYFLIIIIQYFYKKY